MRIEAYYLPDHRDRPAPVATVDQARAIVDALTGLDDFDTSMATLYIRRDDETATLVELAVGVDPSRGVGSLQYLAGDSRYFSKGNPSDYEEVVYCHLGHERPFPRDSEIPLDHVKDAVADFAATGGDRPASVTWQHAAPAET
ncbi:MAG: Imm1 family immunity protein [Stackebrandtia sp.]